MIKHIRLRHFDGLSSCLNAVDTLQRLLILVLILCASAAKAVTSNPQLMVGTVGALTPPFGSDMPLNSSNSPTRWAIRGPSGANLAWDGAPAGWGVSYDGLNLLVSVPASAQQAPGYEAKYWTGTTAKSGYFDVVLSISPPASPSGLTALAVSASQVNVSWTDNANNESSYKLERKAGTAGTWTQIASPIANTTIYCDTGLSAVTTYFYRMKATNGAGDSSYSNEASASTLITGTTPKVPQGGSRTFPSTGTDMPLYNGAPTDWVIINPSGATIAYSGAPNGWSVSLVSAQSYLTVTAPQAAAIASGYKVRQGGTASPPHAQSASFDVVAPPPAAPSNVLGSAGDSSATISWDASIGATSYTVKRSLTSGANYVIVSTGTATSPWTDTSLSNGTTYYYVVTASNTSGESGPSQEVSVTPAVPSHLADVSLPDSITEGCSGFGFVVLTNPATNPGLAITISCSSDLITVPSRLTIQPGRFSATFTIDADRVDKIRTAQVVFTDGTVSVSKTIYITQLETPYAISAFVDDTNVCHITWTAAKGSTTTVVERQSGSDWQQLYNGSGTSYDYQLTTDEAPPVLRLQARNQAVNSDYSNTVRATIPEDVIEWNESEVVGGIVMLSWVAPHGYTDVTLQRASKPDGPFVDFAAHLEYPNFIDRDVSPGLTYCYRTVCGRTDQRRLTSTVVTLAVPEQSGLYPNGRVAFDGNSTLYGTTQYGGHFGQGAVYTVTTDASGETVYSFGEASSAGGTDFGFEPTGDLLFHGQQMLLSTTQGGANDRGDSFSLSDQLYPTLIASEGRASFVQGPNGIIYGVARNGGDYGYGCIFRLEQAASTVLYSFEPPIDYACNEHGYYPSQGASVSADGAMYGTCEGGGDYGIGTLWRFDTGTGVITTLHSFSWCDTADPDGNEPNGHLLLSNDGSLWGTTKSGGAYETGTLFSWNAQAGYSATSFDALDSMGSNQSGASPCGGLVQTSDGHIFGVASTGGNGYGTLFEVVSGHPSAFFMFDGGSLGSAPVGGLSIGPDGKIYGTTTGGSNNQAGCVFRFSGPNGPSLLFPFWQ